MGTRVETPRSGPDAASTSVEARSPLLRLALRALAGLPAAALLLWLIVPVTAAGVWRERAPEAALRIAPNDARAAAFWAQGQLANFRRPGVLDRIQGQARAALMRDPTVVGAVDMLGFVATARNDLPAADRAYPYAEFLSRRDNFAQLWLLERSVQRNDIKGALTHYDNMLRTSPPMGAQLFPILAGATATPGIATEVNRLLRTRPNWEPDFVSALLTAQSDPNALFAVTRGLLGTSDPREREQLALLLTTLTRLEAFDLAWRAYADALPARARGGPALRNGGFADDPGFAPFDWGFADEPALAPERRARANGNVALFLPTGANADAEVARQLVRLAPGAYVLSAEAGAVTDEAATRPQLIVSCARAPHRALGAADLPVSPDSGRGFALRFAVPADCAYQWISVRVRGNYDRQMTAAAWIDSIRIAASRGAAR